ncbi:hypothetical protein [Clostridium sp. Marseille-Q2269]|uniref:hypothetical protein n=1 Tax=Clostridium sp. Marseille-Q2269 TaxID=2942205 RepID=UPI002073F618|nr:hypothetical protein [Clostridium sp. Marseille-Q2269]
MKRIIILVLSVLLVIWGLTHCTLFSKYHTDKLYSEKDINKNLKFNNLQSSNSLTREKALKKALDIFKKGFNVDMNRNELIENIRIETDYKSGNLCWNITLRSIDNMYFSQCIIDTTTEEITYLTYNKSEGPIIGKYSLLSKKEILQISNSLFKELKINPNNYYIKYDENIKNYKTDQYKIIYFQDMKHKDNKFMITINCKSKSVFLFQKL